YRAVEVPTLRAFTLGREPYARQRAFAAEQQNRSAHRQPGIVVDLLHVPHAGRRGDQQPAQVQQGKAQDCVPRKRVAHTPVWRIWFVLIKTQDIRPWFHSWQLTAQTRYA